MFWILFSNFNTCSVEIVYEYVNILQSKQKIIHYGKIQTRRHLSGSQFKASMTIYLKIRTIYVALVDMGTMADVIVFKSVRFQMSTLIRYVCVSICIHFQQRFQIDAFSVNTLSVFERISVDGRPKRINLYAFSNENALVWTGPKPGDLFQYIKMIDPISHPVNSKLNWNDMLAAIFEAK